MKKILIISFVFTVLISISCNSGIQSASDNESAIALLIHGGAGTILKENMTPERELEYREFLTKTLDIGYEILKNGGTSLDAIQAVIMKMEDSPLFNAGKGAVFTNEGTNEMDASIMDGSNLNAGAVAAIKNIKNPIQLARLVMEKSPHVMLAQEGAVTFAEKHGIAKVDDDYFYTKRRWDALQREQQKPSESSGLNQSSNHDQIYSTVGAVALDKFGNLAAGTSTGGLTNKQFGRVGDSPIIGAGTYANNRTCAISSTGHGEYFMRSLTAYDISAIMEYSGKSIQQAAEIVIQDKLTDLGGTGGIIGLDFRGNIVMEFNTAGMYRGYVLSDGKPNVFIYKDE
ncbi:isoaspartyl peptidase/L-asparaginase family protein [Candidatus Neomarinimicrobiota bacterium]